VAVRVTHERWGQFRDLVLRRMADRLDRAIRLIHTELVTSISTQGSYVPPVHSRPGDPPYRQTGDLIASWQTELDRAGLVGRVSSDSEYVLRLEFGYPPGALDWPAPRPHARRAFYSQVYHCAAMLGAPM
jgi:hypothetical protein